MLLTLNKEASIAASDQLAERIAKLSPVKIFRQWSLVAYDRYSTYRLYMYLRFLHLCLELYYHMVLCFLLPFLHLVSLHLQGILRIGYRGQVDPPKCDDLHIHIQCHVHVIDLLLLVHVLRRPPDLGLLENNNNNNNKSFSRGTLRDYMYTCIHCSLWQGQLQGEMSECGRFCKYQYRYFVNFAFHERHL